MNYLNIETYLASLDLDKSDLTSIVKRFKKCDVYLTGSLACGHGTPSSDIDMHILTDDGSEISFDREDYSFTSGNISSTVIDLGHVPIDVDIIPLNLLTNSLKKINSMNFKDKDSDCFTQQSEFFSNEQLISIVHRLLTGNKIKENLPVKFEGILNISNWFKWRTIYHSIIAENTLDDVIGFIDVSDKESAIYSIRTLAVKTAFAYLASRKVSLDREKWVLFHLRNLTTDTSDFLTNIITMTNTIDAEESISKIDELLAEMRKEISGV